jgi:hypothetical protein
MITIANHGGTNLDVLALGIGGTGWCGLPFAQIPKQKTIGAPIEKVSKEAIASRDKSKERDGKIAN